VDTDGGNQGWTRPIIKTKNHVTKNQFTAGSGTIIKGVEKGGGEVFRRAKSPANLLAPQWGNIRCEGKKPRRWKRGQTHLVNTGDQATRFERGSDEPH